MSRPLRAICWVIGYGLEIALSIAIPWGAFVAVFDVFTGASVPHAISWGMLAGGCVLWLMFAFLSFTEWLLSKTDEFRTRFRVANLLDELRRLGHSQASTKYIVNIWHENQSQNERVRILLKGAMYGELRRAVIAGYIRADLPEDLDAIYNCDLETAITYFRRIRSPA